MENKPATTIRILNADILDITRDELLRRLDRGVLVTPNVDHLVKLQSDPEFLRIYRQAEWVVCDSKIIQIMSRMLRRPFPEAASSPHSTATTKTTQIAAYSCSAPPKAWPSKPWTT